MIGSSNPDAKKPHLKSQLPIEAATGLLANLKAQRAEADPAKIIGGLSDPRLILQDYRPLALSLEWEIGAQHWRDAGVRPFVRNEVPFVINNDGRLSASAAELLVACGQDNSPGAGSISVVEYGAGCGLFARFFLDALRDLCREKGADDYDRLTYYITDASAQTVTDWMDCGLFEEHKERVVLAVCEAEQPGVVRTTEGKAIELPRVRAVFCNYVFDVLPNTVLRRHGTSVEELFVRTFLSTNSARIAERTPLRADELLALARSDEPAERARLTPVMALFEYETAFRPLTRSLPYLDEALACGKDAERVPLNYGALALLAAASAQLEEKGFLLINDYGATDPAQQTEHSIAQRFGATSALGINFPLIEHFAAGRGLRVTAAPGDGQRTIHTRLITTQTLPETERTFSQRFAATALAAQDEPMQRARSAGVAGNYGEALDFYRLAISADSRNWWALAEIAEFVLFQIKDAGAALELARRATELNPSLSAWVWNVLGDALWTLERQAEAHIAYERAHSINPDEPRTLLNLAYVYLWRADHTAALGVLARGLASDRSGSYRERLLAMQQNVLSALATAFEHERENAMLRFTRFQAVCGTT
jgi:tetratricopeptide (TPR) repeat protein